MSLVLFTLLYVVLAGCIVYPPIECISAGLTIATMGGSVLGSESERFVMYHIRRSVLTLFIYSLLPLGYVLGLWTFNYFDEVLLLWNYDQSYLCKIFTATCFVLPLLALYQINDWYTNNWEKHPIAQNVSKFCNNNSSWLSVASDIDIEYRRVDKICIQTNAVCTVIATENWILKVLPFTIYVAHQSDASLEVNQSDTHNISHVNTGDVQYVNIQVKTSRNNIEPFTIRLNALDFKDLQDRVARTITVLSSVTFHKTLEDRFVETFKELIKENPNYNTRQELENCIGCMQISSNVKLQKVCADESDNGCRNCYCRPMWCADCMAKWFASRQDSEQPDTWLSSKCTCPMCRATFCLLDVCMINNISQN